MAADDDELRFEWDDRKARSNLATHGVSFEMAAAVLGDPMRLEEDDRFARANTGPWSSASPTAPS